LAVLLEKLQVDQGIIDRADGLSVLTEFFPRGYDFPVDQLHRAA
jgi:hypothetical protein